MFPEEGFGYFNLGYTGIEYKGNKEELYKFFERIIKTSGLKLRKETKKAIYGLLGSEENFPAPDNENVIILVKKAR